MKNLFLILLALPLTLLAADEKPILKIGAILPMSGNSSFIGEMAQRGLELAIDGVVDPRYDYQLIVEDDGMEYKRTSLAAQKLKDVDKVDVMLTAWGYGSSIALPIIKGSDVVHFSLDRWTLSDAPHDFVHGPQVESYVALIMNMVRQEKMKKVAMAIMSEHGAMRFRQVLKDALNAEDVEIVEDIVVNFGQNDFRSMVMRIKQKQPDLFVNNLFMPAQAIFAKQAHDLGFDVPEVMVSASIEQIEGQLVEGNFVVMPISATPAFKAAFESKYGMVDKYPAPEAYNTMSTVLAAAQATQPVAGKLDVTGFEEALKEIRDLPGAQGPLNFVAPKFFPALCGYYRMLDGKLTQISEVQMLDALRYPKEVPHEIVIE